jgi:tRNA 2-thiouridine synthesizing protein E
VAEQIGIDLTDAHWKAIRFLRADYADHGETATLRRVATVGGIPTKELFTLFPKKPAKKMAYIAGLPKPRGWYAPVPLARPGACRFSQPVR